LKLSGRVARARSMSNQALVDLRPRQMCLPTANPGLIQLMYWQCRAGFEATSAPYSGNSDYFQ
jgi:hypothetical protein